MTFVSTALELFFESFNLRKSSEAIYFDALVDYKLAEKEIQIQTKVAIVTSVNNPHDTIFILSTYLIALGFPDVFRSDRNLITFDPGEPLKIVNRDKKAGDYTVLIQPVLNDICNDY